MKVSNLTDPRVRHVIDIDEQYYTKLWSRSNEIKPMNTLINCIIYVTQFLSIILLCRSYGSAVFDFEYK